MTNDYVTADNYVGYIWRPKNKYEQITSSIMFVLDNKDHYNALQFLPRRLEACAIKMFKEDSCSGYHPFVIRSALMELDSKGQIALDEAPYDM